MKKILISLKDLKIGGIEKSAIELIEYLIEHGYTVTLILEEKKGELLGKINSNVKILEYKPCSIKFMPLRKFINLIKKIKFMAKYKNKFDIAISYATYSKMCSYVTRVASKNTILWCHADYLELFDKKENEARKFFKSIKYNRFSKIIFVSKAAKKTFLQLFPTMKNTYFCNNLINSKEIVEKSKEKIKSNYGNKTVFLNVGRHDEKQKKLTRIIEAARKLKNEKYEFEILFIGDGIDTKVYKNLVKRYGLKKYIVFIGAKKNPYPYFKIADAVILSSKYEGYPVVFLESYILNKPIITTKVSDYEDIENGRGIVTNNDSESIFNGMKSFLDKGYKIKKDFDIKKYNKEIEQKLSEILEKF